MRLTTFKTKECFGGEVRLIECHSTSLNAKTEVTIFVPAQAEKKSIPYIMALSGLGCNNGTFITKSGILRFAAKYGFAVVAPDTSPRGTGLDPKPDQYWIGEAAGYYINADKEPYASHFRMHSWVSEELPKLVSDELGFDDNNKGITGHSMGGLGALMMGLKYPEKWKSVSAFAPATCAVDSDWTTDAGELYFNDPKKGWEAFSPAALLKKGAVRNNPILIDQGLSDEFFSKLGTDEFEKLANTAGQELILRRHPKYDHSYWFIQSFIESHMAFHALYLKKS